MGTLAKLKLLDKRENKVLNEIKEIRKHRTQLLEELELQQNNVKLNRKQVANILEYNYYYLSRLNLPFEGNKIYYLNLLDWVKKNKPGRIKRMQQNFNSLT